MIPLKKKLLFRLLIPILFLQIISCKTSQPVSPETSRGIQSLKPGGGSSGMEKLGGHSFLVVYDLKSYKEGIRMAMINITEEGIGVSPVNISGWDKEGRSSDLESICRIPGKTDEYLIAESGNWEGGIGRIFHIRVDTASLSAKVLGTTKLPYKNINNLEVVGDQYESMACLPYSQSGRILILAERGGSKVNPRGIVRWGLYDLSTHQLEFSDSGMEGIAVNAPGNWTNEKWKRDITDLHIDEEGGIWASASEETSEMGPFYSVIYKIGEVDASSRERPFQIYSSFSKWESVAGFKIEALSGPSKNIESTHSFGTEDEIYGGIWRAISLK
jgi:hypothetical protein